MSVGNPPSLTARLRRHCQGLRAVTARDERVARWRQDYTTVRALRADLDRLTAIVRYLRHREARRP